MIQRRRPIRAFWTEAEAEADAVERGACLIMLAPHVDAYCSVPAERTDQDIAETLADILTPGHAAELQRVLALVHP